MQFAVGSLNPGASAFPAAARLSSPKSCCRELQWSAALMAAQLRVDAQLLFFFTRDAITGG